jgi:hypothetical protein
LWDLKLLIMKTLFLLLFLTPLFTFGQLTAGEKDSIDTYAMNMCTCVNDLIAELHPLVADMIIMMGEKGEEAGMVELEEWMTDMDYDELMDFNDSAMEMDSPDFINRLEGCAANDGLSKKIREQLDKGEGDAQMYLLGYMSGAESCQLMNALYDLGMSEEE